MENKIRYQQFEKKKETKTKHEIASYEWKYKINNNEKE